MANKDQNISKIIIAEEPPSGMYERICTTIERAETRRLRARAALHASIMMASIIGFVPALTYLIDRFSRSGFSEYLSLASSDTSYVFHNLGSFALSLADSLPVSASIMTIVIVLVSLYSMSRLARYWSSISMREHSGYYSLQNI